MKTYLCFQLTTRNLVESWSAKSAGKNFGIIIVWYVAQPGHVVAVQAAGEEHTCNIKSLLLQILGELEFELLEQLLGT